VSEQDRADSPASDRSLDGPTNRGRQREQDDLVTFAVHAQNAVTVLFAEVADVAAGGLQLPQTQQAEHRDQRELASWVDCLAAVSIASNSRWLRPSVGDSAGTVGRRTYSVGECSRTRR